MDETDTGSGRTTRASDGEGSRNDRDGREPARQDGESRSGAEGQTERLLGWFTETVLRLAVAVVGVALLLLALGQIVGVNLYSIVLDLLQSDVGQWSVVAIFAVLLILAASKRWNLVDTR